jgi:hypothetical protein
VTREGATRNTVVCCCGPAASGGIMVGRTSLITEDSDRAQGKGAIP